MIKLAIQPFELDYRDVSQFHNITLNNTSINTSGISGGGIALQGRTITLAQSAKLTAITSGEIAGQGIHLKASEMVDFQGNPLSPTNIANTVVASYALASASGKSGDITIEAPYFRMTDGAAIDMRALGPGDSGNTIIKSHKVDVIGEVVNPITRQRIAITTIASNVGIGAKGKGGDIRIEATEVNVRDGAELRASARGTGSGGSIYITGDRLNVTGETAIADPSRLTGITTSNREEATGQGGNIVLNVRKIALLDGAGIRTGTYGEGSSGNISINADEVTIAGSSSKGVSSRIFSSAYGTYNLATQQLIRLGKAQGGDIEIQTNTLNLLNGGKISTSTETQGKAGQLSVSAHSINIAGVSQRPSTTLLFQDSTGPSGLYASSTGPGDAGSVYLFAQAVNLSNSGEIVVSGQSSGNAGNLYLKSDTIQLAYAAKLRAEATVKDRGNIEIDANTLLLRHGSVITANSTKIANGGNIKLNIPVIVGLENSDIIANSVSGRGGNITITTQGMIGLEFRSTLTPRTDLTNDITVSSQFNINGDVAVNSVGLNPANSLNVLPVDTIDPSHQIADRCAAAKTGSFISTGRGGIPRSPIQTHKAGRTWNDLRNTGSDRSATTAVIIPIAQAPLVEASVLRTNADGSIDLIAPIPSAIDSGATCAIRS